MDDETALALNRLNVGFYRSHAGEFSERRQRPWRGWSRLLDLLPDRDLRVLDVGCGNARFGRFLAAHRHLAAYTGVDASEPLLEIARRDPPPAERTSWTAADFVASPPDRALPRQRYDLVALFGVLHGVPGEAHRRQLLETCADRLAPGGLLVFTCWGFTADPRISRRIEAPEGLPSWLDVRALDPGDHLVPWGDAGGVFRYGRDIGPAERRRLLAALDLAPLREFTDDGPERAHNHYSVARRALPGERKPG
jgi:SAM-dependent methyltransferase